MYPLLKAVFPSTTGERAIPHVAKTYKADFAISELRALVEFKFCNTKGDWPRALDEVYADMKGYAGTSEWRHFFVVFYLTDRFTTQEEVVAEFKLTGSGAWKPVVVFGTAASEEPAG